MTKWLHLLIPTGLGVLAFWMIQPAHWHGIRQGLILLLSLLGAAVLVRLSKGIPVLDTGYFEVKELKALTEAVAKLYRALAILFSVIISSIITLAFVHFAHSWIYELELGSLTKLKLMQVFTGLIITLVAFAISRTFSVIQGDFDLMRLQGDIMKDVVVRRHAERRAAQLERAEEKKPYREQEGYGELVQES